MHSEQERHYFLGMDAVLSICTRKTNVIRVWAWILWLSDALRRRTLSWFGLGSSGYRMHSEHKRYHVLGMDALVTARTRNTNVIMVWARMLWLSYATQTSKTATRGTRSTYLGPSKHFECVGSCHAGHIPRGRKRPQAFASVRNRSQASAEGRKCRRVQNRRETQNCRHFLRLVLQKCQQSLARCPSGRHGDDHHHNDGLRRAVGFLQLAPYWQLLGCRTQGLECRV